METSTPDFNIEELLARIAPPAIPDEGFDAAPRGQRDLLTWHRRYAAAILSALQTIPTLHANDLRLDWLLRLVLSKSTGKKKPSGKDLMRVLNEGFDEANVLRLEDPIEDAFCEHIVTSRGNFRIFPGRWESAGPATQTVLDAFISIAKSPAMQAALDGAFALLALSDLLCERSGVNIQTSSSGAAMGKITLPDKERLTALSRRVRFKARDLESIGLDMEDLALFFLPDEYSSYVSDRLPGNTPLELHPLLQHEEDVYVLSPPNLSVAIRSHLIMAARDERLLSLFQRRLMEEQEAFSESTVFWPMPNLWLSPPNARGFRTSVCQYDRGCFLHILQVPTPLDGFPHSGFGSFVALSPEQEQFVADDIRRFWSFADGQGDCRRSATVLLVGGWGGGLRLAPPATDDAPPHWHCLPLSYSDAAVLGTSGKGKFTDLIRIDEQLKRLHAADFEITNVNGWLNLFSHWRETDGNILPEHEHRLVPPCHLALPTDALRSIRAEAAEKQDRRAVPLPEGGFKSVQRKDWGRDALRPVYASIDDVRNGRLSGVVRIGPCAIWIETTPGRAGNRSWQYQLWNAILQWLATAGARLAKYQPDMFPAGARRITFTMPDDETPMRFDPPGDKLPQLATTIATMFDDDGGVVNIQKEWGYWLTRAENVAEVELAASVIHCIVRDKLPDRSQVVDLVRGAIGSNDWRWLHAQERHDPVRRLRGHGFVGKFNAVPFSANALVRCCSAWQFRSRDAGHSISGTDDCKTFLTQNRNHLLEGLLAEVRKFDREALTIAGAKAFHAARSEQLWWRDTIRALRAINGEAADAAAFEMQSDVNAVIRTAKVICEVAACEAPLTGGLIPAQYQLEELMSRVLMLFLNGQIFHSIRGGLMPAELRISPAGDVLSERMTAADLVKPGASWLHKRVLDQAEKGYAAPRKSEETTERIPWEPEFRAAIEHEYAASSEAYFDLQFALMHLVQQAGRDVIAIRRSKLVEFLADCPGYPKVDGTGLLQRLTLRCRPTWNSGLTDNETDLSRFDRKHSLINRPLLAIDDLPDPLLVVAPGLVSEAAVYAIGGLHNGDLNNTFWESDRARKLAGEMGNKAGRAFERKVARTLCDIGLDARSGCKIPKLLGVRLAEDPGDIDVFLLSRDRRRAWVIEAKELRLCRTEGEAASRLNEYRGLMQRDKKGKDRPDKLLKHLRRVQLLRDNSTRLAKVLGLAQSPEIKGLLVFDTPQPMNFRRMNVNPDAECVFLDRIAEFEF